MTITKEWLLTLLPDFQWIQTLGTLWNIGRKVLNGVSSEGIYEVIDYECAIEILNKDGTRANIYKKEKIKYLQNNVTSFQDQAYGNGEILLNYHCSPGIPIDQYQFGHNTYKLISLREIRNKGDVDEFNIEWEMNNSFLKPTGFWGTEINHRTKRIKLVIVFPIDRPPLKYSVFEKNYKKTFHLMNDVQKKLPDGRQAIIWEKTNPRLYENYILSWEW